MSTIYRVQVMIPRNTNLPEDVVVNTFHFVRNGTAEGAFLDEVDNLIEAAYTEWRNVLGNNAVLTGLTWKYYDLSDPEPRAPVSTRGTTAITNPTDDPLPSECAAVVTWKAAAVSGVPSGRLQGRTYIGPLDRSTQSASDRDRLDSSAYNALALGAEALITSTVLDFDEGLAVYSRADDAARLVTNGWVDNAYDTQRRRGKAPTARLVFPL